VFLVSPAAQCLASSARQCQDSSATTFQDKSVQACQDNKRNKIAKTSQGNSAQALPDKNAPLFQSKIFTK
jgi:hypothetical protein